MNHRIGSLSESPRAAGTLVLQLLQQLGFWGSVLLPVAYLPIIFALSGMELVLALSTVLLLNVCCLVLGHEYSR